MLNEEYSGDELLYVLRKAHRTLTLLANGQYGVRSKLPPIGVILGRREAEILKKREAELNDLYGIDREPTPSDKWMFRGDPVVLADCDSVVGFAFFTETD